jgi:signal peptide peptidase SppA
MKLLDIITAPWAIEPSKLLEIQAIYATHLRGEKIDIPTVEARLGRPLDNTQQPKGYAIQDGVAILSLEGVIAKRANLFMEISGGVSTQLVERDLKAALADPAVHSIILAIDSPGGTVDGTITLANIVAGAEKPVAALASGTMASAAYWIGSAASAGVYITDATTNVGSIGVVATHTDVSKAQAAQGIKTTEIAAGKYKRIASQFEPLTKEGRQTIQDQVDHIYGLFVDAVAAHRGVSADSVLQNMADGRIFIGQQAIDAGLVDGVSTLDALVAQLNERRSSGNQPGAGAAPKAKTQTTGKPMPITREQLAADEPGLLKSILAEGAAQERARIQAVEDQLVPGHEALITALKFDGKSTGGDAAMAVLAAEKQARSSAAAANAADAPKPLPLTPATTVQAAESAPKTRQQIDAEAKAYVAAHPGTDYLAAVKHVTQGA